MSNLNFRQFEQDFWEKSASPYNTGFGGITSQTAPYILNALDVSEGMEFLDIACGPGYIASAAKERGAKATGIDFSAPMIDLAKSTNPEVYFQVEDAQNLSFEDHSFDAVGCNFGIMHMEDPQKAFSEAYRVCKEKAHYAYVVWDSPENSPLLNMLFSAIKKHGTMDVNLPEGLPFFHFANQNTAQSALKGAGFTDIDSETIHVEWKLTGAEQLLSSFRDGGARMGGILRHQTKDAYNLIQNEIQDEMQKYQKNDSFYVPVNMVMTKGVK